MTVFKKIFVIVITMLTCSLVLGGCKQSNPEITTSITLSNIIEDEFIKISESSKPEGANINELKKLYIDVKITNSKKATDRMISIPDLYIIDTSDRVRTTGGSTSFQNNIKREDTAESTAYIIFNSEGLSEQDIRNLYSKSEIYVSYKLKNSKLVIKNISIGDVLTVN